VAFMQEVHALEVTGETHDRARHSENPGGR
jgi:hypothetical protein